MEPTTMPNLNPSMPVQSLAQGSGRGQALTGSAGAGALDPFLEIIQRMAAQMQEGSFGQTLPNIQGAEANAPGGLEGDEDLLTAYAAMLVSGVQVLPEPGGQPAVETVLPGGESLQAAASLSGELSQVLAALEVDSRKLWKGPGQEDLSGLKENGAKGFAAALQEKGAPIVELRYQQENFAGAGFSGEKEGQLFRLQRQFSDAVNTVRRQLAEYQPKTDQKLDVDLLQQQVNLRTGSGTGILPPTAFEEIPPEEPLSRQISLGLEENLALGKREFTLKLKPESLGEITVKLIEKAGKMSLTISAASAQTARLINSDLSALREAVRPMQVEVHEAVTEAPQSEQSQLYFDMAGQQFGGRQAYTGREELPGYYPLKDNGERAEEGQILKPDSALDAYI